MNAKITNQQPFENYIKIVRYCENRETATPGAYSVKDICRLRLEISRKLGICEAFLCITDDANGEDYNIQLEYTDSELGKDIYEISLDLSEMCGNNTDDLFYYYFKFISYPSCFYTSSVNNVDFTITDSENEINKFRLLVYDDSFATPDWAKDAVMYHIFVDRFNKTEHKLPVRADCKINGDWYNGIPEYAPYPGAHLENNEFFGGSIYGIIEKLDYFLELGVNCLYLSPIFKAYSNHKYDTGDYMKIDEMFGGEEAFSELLKEAEKRRIHIILDGVFNHTGDDSRYFNAKGKYDSVGAGQSYDSEYHNWYYFKEFPHSYDCWWGIKILPKLNNNNPATVDYFLGEKGVVRKYIGQGTSGWRLDVADELPHDFLTNLRIAVKSENKDALIIGEVWENAADKVAYGKRRKYFSGGQLDSVMNYPIKNAIVSYMKTGDCTQFYNTVTELYASYPPECSSVLMNLLGTHDTERILTLLVCNDTDYNLSNNEKATYRLDYERRKYAIRLLKIASVLQFALPGMPCIFYGDEAGMEGMGDPFCRRPYPWGNEEAELVKHYKKLGKLKRSCKALKGVEISFEEHGNGVCVFKRGKGKDTVYVCVNMTDKPIECPYIKESKLLFGECTVDGDVTLLPAKSAVIAGA